MNTTYTTTSENYTSSVLLVSARLKDEMKIVQCLLKPRATIKNTETATLASRQSPSFVIPVSVVVLLLVLGIIVAASFYAWRRKLLNRPKPLPLPNPYPENELPVRFRSSNSEENDHCYNDDNLILIQSSPSQRESLELSHFEGASAEAIYQNLPISQKEETRQIYENCDFLYYENCNSSHDVNLK